MTYETAVAFNLLWEFVMDGAMLVAAIYLGGYLMILAAYAVDKLLHLGGWQ